MREDSLGIVEFTESLVYKINPVLLSGGFYEDNSEFFQFYFFNLWQDYISGDFPLAYYSSGVESFLLAYFEVGIKI